MTIQFEIQDNQDVQLILNLLNRLKIPFRQFQKAPKPKTQRENRRDFILNFEAREKSSFGDALEWQRRERTDNFLPFQSN